MTITYTDLIEWAEAQKRQKFTWLEDHGPRSKHPRPEAEAQEARYRDARFRPCSLQGEGIRVMSTQGLYLRLFDRRQESVSCRRCRRGAEHRIRAGVQRRGIALSLCIRPIFAKQLSCIRGRPHDLNAVEIGKINDDAFVPGLSHFDIPILFASPTSVVRNRSGRIAAAWKGSTAA